MDRAAMSDTNPALQSRLDPMIFPSDTDVRFALLIVSVVSVSVFTFNWIANSLLFGSIYKDLTECLNLPDVQQSGVVLRSPSELLIILSKARDEARLAETLFAFIPERWRPLLSEVPDYRPIKDCLQTMEVGNGLLVLFGASCVLGLAWLFYRLEPVRILKWQHLEIIPPEDASDILKRMHELARVIGLRQTPAFVWNPLDSSVSGLAFGRRGKYSVAITGGLATRFVSAPDEFDAVVLHEMSHLRNGDVSKTYFAVALWRAYVIAGLLPFGLSLCLSLASFGTAFDLFWRIAVLTLLVFLTRNSILRSRELYADARAVQFEDIQPALSRVLAKAPQASFSRLRRLFAMHPTGNQRMEAARSGTPLFRASAGTVFMAGIAGAIGFSALRDIIDQFLPLSIESAAPVLASLILASLAGATLGISMWRAQLACQAMGKIRARNVGWLGVCLALGLILGRWLSPDMAVILWFLSGSLDLLFLLLAIVFWTCALSIGLFLLAHWTSDSASRALVAATSARHARKFLFVGVAVLSITIAMLTGVAFALSQPAAGILSTVFLVIFRASPLDAFTIQFGPALTALTFAMLWIFPLTMQARGRSIDPGRNWPLLSASNEVGGVHLVAPRSLRPVVAVMAGAISGLVFLLALPTLALFFGALSVRETDYLFGRLCLSGALIQAVAAVIVLLMCRTALLAHTLLVALVAGGLIAIACLGWFAPNQLSVGRSVPEAFTYAINLCSLTGCAVALGGCAVQSLRARRD
jgi:Zn-dependent protease with chaperone function